MTVPRSPAAPAHRGPRAFTLVELMISTALLTFMALLLFSVLEATATLWRNNEARVESFREARAGLNLMAREISQTFADPAAALPVMVINPSPTRINQPASIERDPVWGGRIFFLATIAGGAQASGENRSDLCALGYYLAFTRDVTAFSPDAQGAGHSSYKVYRHFRSSNPTFEALQASLAPGGIFLPSPTPAGDEVLARNITRLEIRLFERLRDASTGDFIRLQEVDLSTGWPVTKRPAMIEISLTALNEDTAAKLTSQDQWKDHSSLLQKRESQRFVTRIKFPD